MKFLCLIRAERVMEQFPVADANQHSRNTPNSPGSSARAAIRRREPSVAPEHRGHCARARGQGFSDRRPVCETKEQLGGYYVIEAMDVEEAIQVAAASRAQGTVASKCSQSRKMNRRCARWAGN